MYNVAASICENAAAAEDDIKYVMPQEETNPGNDYSKSYTSTMMMSLLCH